MIFVQVLSLRMIWSTVELSSLGLVPTLMIKDTLNTSMYLKVAITGHHVRLPPPLQPVCNTYRDSERSASPVKTKLRDSFSEASSVFKSRSFKIFIGIPPVRWTSFQVWLTLCVDDVLGGYDKGISDYADGRFLHLSLSKLIHTDTTRTSKHTRPILIGAPIRLASTLDYLRFHMQVLQFVPYSCSLLELELVMQQLLTYI